MVSVFLFRGERIVQVENSNNNNNNNNSSRFKIAGGTSGMKVSWQVTGIRKDLWANASGIQVEEDKPAKELGYYICPDLYGQPEDKGITRLLCPPEESYEVQRKPSAWFCLSP